LEYESLFRASEFYLEYGDFDINITAPANHIVVSSGRVSKPYCSL
jgi:hypothetical protein